MTRPSSALHSEWYFRRCSRSESTCSSRSAADVGFRADKDRNYYQLRTSFVDGNGITQFTFTPYTIDKTFSCFSDPNSPTVLVIPLVDAGNNVGLMLPGAQGNRFYEENILTISNLKNPSVFNTYAVSLVVYSDQSTSALETYTKSVAITSPPFSLTSNFFSYFGSEWTLVEFSFSAPIALEKGNRVLTNFYDQFTVLRFRFFLATAAPNPMFDRFLGYTSTTASSNLIPCWASGDLNTYNPGLNCTITYGPSSATTTDSATITVNNYKALNFGDSVIVQFMVKYAVYVATPTVNPTISGSIVSIQTNEEFPIGTITQSLTPATNTAGAAFTTLTATASLLEVQATTTLTFTMNLPASAISVPTALMIKLPSNWAFSTSIFAPTTVFFDGVQLFTGKFYYNSYAKILYITPRDAVTAGTHTVQIVGIISPLGASATNTFDVSYYVNRAQTLVGSVNVGAITCFPMPTITVTSQIPNYGAKGASYFFKWTSAKYYSVPTIVITLPAVTEYTFVAGGPYDCDLYINNVLQRKDISPYSQVCTYSVGSSTFQMKLSKDIPIGTTIMVAIRYVNHPAANPGAADVQILSSTTDPNTLVTTSAVTSCAASVPLDNTNVFTNGAFVPGVITFTQIWSTALIAEQEILMYFDFTLNSFLPKGTNLEVFFPPSSFVSVALRINPRCYLIGKQKHLSVCTTFEDTFIKKIIMTLADDFPANTPLTLEFFGRSFYTKPTYDPITDNSIGPFSISATYAATTIATSNTITTWRIYDKINPATMYTPVPSLMIDPINEAERALYTFTVDFTQILELQRFPTDYDPRLTIYPLTVTCAQLEGALNIRVSNNDVLIYGFYYIKLRLPLVLNIYGIINPNKVPNYNITGFQIGVLDKDNQTRCISQPFGNLYIEQAPNIMELLTLKSNIPYTRYDDNYTVEITSDFGVLDSNNGGQIRVRYPEDFYMDVFSGTCQTEDRFSLYSVCTQFYNDYVFNSANKAYDFRQSGSLKFNINTHRNAEYAGLTGPITVQNYDATNRLILARSFSTLSVSFMNFTYDGLQLQVNSGNPFSLEVGSLSDPINIGPIELMKQRLTVVPLYFDSNFIFSGTPVTLVPGTTGTGFRLAAPQTMLRKRFFLTFSKSGDLIQKFYAPIPKFPVDIVKGTLMRTVTPSVTLYINKGGISVPLYVDVPNPPYEVVTTTIAASDPTFKLNATLLSFSKSTSRLYYYIKESSSSFAGTSLTLTLTLGGTDSSSYQLSTSTLNIPVQPADTTPAPFVDILIMENNRGNVKIKVKSNKLAYVYCATGYQYMPEPTYDMVKGQNLTSNYSYSKPLYHSGYVDTAAFEGIVVVDGLNPSYFYTTYCYTMNLNGVPSPTFSKLSFQNKLPQRIATFTMKINQPTVSQELREEYVKRLATLMQIETTRLSEKLFCKSEAPVGSEANTTYITYYVMPDPTNNEDDISPINLVRSLNKQRSNIVKFIPTLDPGNLLVMKEVKVTPPNFKTRPILDRRGTDWMTINVTSSVCGYAMIAAQPVEGTRWLLSTNSTFFYFENQIIKGVYAADKEFYPYGIQNANGETNTFTKYGGAAYKPTNNSLRRRRLKVIEYTDLSLVERYPTAFQLNNTLNQTNLPEKLLFNKTLDDTSQVWTINVTGLQDNLIYNIYVGLVSDKPTYPDYMEQDYVAQINLKTVQRRTLLNIYSINAGFWIRMSVGLLLAAFAALLM